MISLIDILKESSDEKIISSVIEKIIRRYTNDYGIPKCEINTGECENFMYTVSDTLKKEYGINVDTLSDAMFYDPFNKYDDPGIQIPEDVGSKTLWDYKTIGMPAHYWIMYKGKHYDSDSPIGTDNFFKLKTFQDWYAEYKRTGINRNDKSKEY